MVVAYAGPLAQADLTERHPIEVLDEQHDDHDAVEAHVHLMQQHLSAEDLNKWRLSAWEMATEIVTTKREQLRATAEALTRERTLTEERLKELAADTAALTSPPSV
jgi:arsenate reductase-like glutaredoxin family protein